MSTRIDRVLLEQELTSLYAGGNPSETFAADLEQRLAEQANGTLVASERPRRRRIPRPGLPALPPVIRPLAESLVVVVPLVVLALMAWRVAFERPVDTADEAWPARPPVGATALAVTPATATRPAVNDDGRSDLAAPVSDICLASTSSTPLTVTVQWVLAWREETWVGIGVAGPPWYHSPGGPGYPGPATGAVPPAHILVGGQRLAADIADHPNSQGAYPSCDGCPAAGPNPNFLPDDMESYGRAYRFPPLPEGTTAFTLEVAELPPCTLVQPMRMEVALRPHAQRLAETAALEWLPVSDASAIVGGFGITVTDVAHLADETLVRILVGPAGGWHLSDAALPAAEGRYYLPDYEVTPRLFYLDEGRRIEATQRQRLGHAVPSLLPVIVAPDLGQAYRPGHDYLTVADVGTESRPIDEIEGADPAREGLTKILSFEPIPRGAEMMVQVNQVYVLRMGAREGPITIDFDRVRDSQVDEVGTLTFGPIAVNYHKYLLWGGLGDIDLLPADSATEPHTTVVDNPETGWAPEDPQFEAVPMADDIAARAVQEMTDLTSVHRFDVAMVSTPLWGRWWITWDGLSRHGIAQVPGHKRLEAEGTAASWDPVTRVLVLREGSQIEWRITLDDATVLYDANGYVRPEMAFAAGDFVSVQGYLTSEFVQPDQLLGTPALRVAATNNLVAERIFLRSVQ